MSIKLKTNYYFSGQGVMLLAPRNADGITGPFVQVAEVSELSANIAENTVEATEHRTGQRGIGKRLSTSTKGTFQAKIESFDADNFALVSRGDVSDVVAAVAATETLTFYFGGITALDAVKLSTLALTTIGGTVRTLVAWVDDDTDWDYTVDLTQGVVQINDDVNTLAQLTIDDFDENNNNSVSLLATYSNDTYRQVDALTKGTTEYWLKFMGLNTAESDADGNFHPYQIDIFRVSSDPFKSIGLIADSLQSFDLSGSILSDASRVSGSKYLRARVVQ